ncbi:MAG TPA: hypothetical protein VGX68_15870 [Thermoanaerobaculia bacterium]|nr:hypothetical protein [Thermoanaerobaculia bacterium]
MHRASRSPLSFLPILLGIALLMTAAAAAAQYCGDGICQYGENCLYDCGGGGYCGDNICTPELGEDEYNCRTDCIPAYCGDGTCNAGESSSSCPADCPPPPTCTTGTCASCSRPGPGDSEPDGLPDQLEYDLAYQYFPALRLQWPGEDLWPSYACSMPSLPYRARPVRYGICDEDLECIEIRYGIAYTQDYGLGGHSGDSEVYAVLLQRTAPWSTASTNPASWQMIRDFTSAHWGTLGDFSVVGAFGTCEQECWRWANDQQGCFQHPECEYFPGSCQGQPSGQNPTVSCYQLHDEGECFSYGCTWIDSDCYPGFTCYSTTPLTTYQTRYAAEGKHANYHTDGECDSGAFWTDECPTNQYNMRDYVQGKLQNIGEDGATGIFNRFIRHPDNTRDYDCWGTEKFGEATPYSQNFRQQIGWSLPNPTSSGSNPFKYATARDEWLACWGIAGRISSNCRDIGDFHDKQMCYAMSDSTQSPCTQMTDRNLQLACYGMSVAPNYPSNCRDITNAELRDFCYSVASWGSQGSCSGVTNAADKALCQALTYRNTSYCASIANANDRWFCYGTASRTNSYCGNIVY